METPKKGTQDQLPKDAAFTLTVPLDRSGQNNATFHIKDMTEDVFIAANSLIDRGKHLDAIRMVIKSLCVGGDNPDVLKDNFLASQSASKLIQQFLEPIPGELKKN